MPKLHRTPSIVQSDSGAEVAAGGNSHSSLPQQQQQHQPVNPITIDLNDAKPVLSRAQRRHLKKPATIVSKEMKEEQREEKREQRKYNRMLKSNGARRKVAKLHQKREREETMCEEAFQALDSDYPVRSRGRRLE